MKIRFKDPLTTFRFLVEVGDGDKKIVAAFTSFSGVTMKVDMVSYRPGSDSSGVSDDIPALTSFEPVTLTRGVIGDNDFLEWIESVTPGYTGSTKGKEMYRTIHVSALDDKGNRAVTWSLQEAIPIVYTLEGMDSTNSAVLSETVRFAIGGFTRQTNAGLMFPNPNPDVIVTPVMPPVWAPHWLPNMLPNWPPTKAAVMPPGQPAVQPAVMPPGWPPIPTP